MLEENMRLGYELYPASTLLWETIKPDDTAAFPVIVRDDSEPFDTKDVVVKYTYRKFPKEHYHNVAS
jgi:hypothetical protein